MLFVLPIPPLERLAGVKIVTHLWSQPDIFTQIAASFDGLPAFKLREDETKWNEIEDQVKSKVWALPLPEPCKKDLLNLVKPIGKEIINWCRFHNLDACSFQLLHEWIPRGFCFWTMHGIIDYKRTAQLIVADERLRVERRYEMACINRLEDEARRLIKFIPKERIRRYIEDEAYYWSREVHVILIAYFTRTLSFGTGEVAYLRRLFQVRDLRDLFNERSWTRAMCAYFFDQLEPEETVGSERLRLLAPTSHMCYFWQMDEERQERAFQAWTRDVLRGLLRWPLQALFVEAAECGWQLVDEGEWSELLDDIVDKLVLGYRDYDYVHLFYESWGLTSDDAKRRFLNDSNRLESLLATREERMIKFLLDEASSSQLKELIEISYDNLNINRVLMDGRVISEAALMECAERAAKKSWKEPENEEKRLRMEAVFELVDLVMEGRTNRRAISGWATS